MAETTHESHVVRQFGPRAAAYVASPVHAQGADLDHLASLVTGHGGARVLDLGCGGGHVSFRVAPHVASVVAYDLSEDMLAAVAGTAAERGLRNIATVRGTAERLDFADASFDFVLTRYSAHHWRDLGAALREARRVLKPSGTAVIVDVVSPGPPLLDMYLQGIEWLRDPSHVRDYSAAEWTGFLQAAHFLPGARSARRLRLDFASWVGRMQTPDLHVRAIRSLQATVAPDVATHFEIEADGSFTIDTMSLEASPA